MIIAMAFTPRLFQVKAVPSWRAASSRFTKLVLGTTRRAAAAAAAAATAAPDATAILNRLSFQGSTTTTTTTIGTRSRQSTPASCLLWCSCSTARSSNCAIPMQPKASLSTATGGGKSPAAASSERSRTSTGHRNYHLMSTISGTVVVLLFGIATSFYIYQQQDAAPLAITSIITNASNLFTFLSFQSTETPNIEQDVDKSTTPTVAETGKEKLTFASPASVGFSKRVSWADLMASKPLEDGPHLKYHPSATDPCSPPQYGEDATFVTSSSLGVGDGVGGWVGKPGADPAYVSRTLMRLTCLELFVNQSSVLSLARAYHKVQADMERSGVLGSTTATVGRIVEGRELEIAHVGDSALFVVRPDGTEGTVVYKTTEQTFMFNGPLQLGTNSSVNVASDAESRNVPILAGDIVIAASDGVVDNLFPDDIAAISIAHSNEIEIARAIALRARQVSEDKGKFTPFEKGAREAGYNYKGGKVDDISVVVGRVVGA